MTTEYKSLISRRSWSVVPLPGGRKAVRCKWVYRTKYNSNGTIARHKARLVAKGFSQIQGINFTKTFAPTVKFTTLRVVFSIATRLDMEVHQSDVDYAFLYAYLEEEIYMTQPPCYEQLGSNGETLVCKL
jgi:hypothetical protein